MSTTISLTEAEISELVRNLGFNNHISRKILFRVKKQNPEQYKNWFGGRYGI